MSYIGYVDLGDVTLETLSEESRYNGDDDDDDDDSDNDAGVVDEVPTGLYTERWRPQVRYTPPYGWMNDPNGLVYAEGQWHMFYQHNPLGEDFGFLSWGHAVSDNLVNWQSIGLAIPFQDRSLIFSGGAVVDEENRSGLCNDEGMARGGCLVALYTANVSTDAGPIQNQNIAYSNNGGRTFQLYEGNPVLDLSLPDFRDPKVFWHEPTERWVNAARGAPRSSGLCVGLARPSSPGSS